MTKEEKIQLLISWIKNLDEESMDDLIAEFVEGPGIFIND